MVENPYIPIESPHPSLRVPHRTLSLSPYLPAENPTPLYRGKMFGQFRDPKKLRQAITTAGYPETTELEILQQCEAGIPGLGTVRFFLWPEPHISWTFGQSLYLPGLDWPELIPPPKESPRLATLWSANVPPEPDLSHAQSIGISRVMHAPLIGNVDEPIDELRFYLVNLQILSLVNDIQREDELDKNALLQLRGGNWTIDIERRLDFSQAQHHLEEQRGYAVTHNCRIKREDGSTFSLKDSEEVTEAIQLFFSFIRGGMVGVALPVGFLNGSPTVEEWKITFTDPGRYPDPNRPRPFHGWYLWFDSVWWKAPSYLPSLFDEFSKLWWHPTQQVRDVWRKVLRSLVYTYTDAERTDESRGVVHAAIALETLCWTVLVEIEQWLTGGRASDGGVNEFDNLTAAGRLRLLLRWANVPTESPSKLGELNAKAKSNNWDGPQMVTWVRNHVVHPDRRNQISDGIATEAFRLALWYTELVILKLLAYDGYYRNRLDPDSITKVPWAPD